MALVSVALDTVQGHHHLSPAAVLLLLPLSLLLNPFILVLDAHLEDLKVLPLLLFFLELSGRARRSHLEREDG